MSLAELLAAVLILGLVGTAMTGGVSAAARSFARSLRASEAEELYTDLQTILANELRYTTEITLKNGSEVDTFFSNTYAIKNARTYLAALDDDGAETDYGQLALGAGGEYNRLLGRAAYPHKLGAAAKVFYDAAGNVFTVQLTISANGTPYLSDRSFQVRPVNEVTVSTE